MEISPLLLLRLLLNALVFGLFLGILNDGSRIVRVFCGVRYSKKSFRSLYARDLPLIHRPLERREHDRLHRWALSALIFVQDILLLVVAAVGTVLLQYEYNSGRFRFFVLPAVLLGFLVYYFTVGRGMMIISEAIAFVIRATILILGCLLLRPIVKFLVIIFKKLKKYAENLCFFIAKRTKKLYNISERKICVRLEKRKTTASDK